MTSREGQSQSRLTQGELKVFVRTLRLCLQVSQEGPQNNQNSACDKRQEAFSSGPLAKCTPKRGCLIILLFNFCFPKVLAITSSA